MSESEEHAWSSRRAHELIEDEGDLLLPPTDKRSQQVRSVLERILAAVEEEERDVLNIREIVSIPGGWKPTHNHALSSSQVGDEERERPNTNADGGQAEEDDDDGPGCAVETDYLVDRERQLEKEAANAKLAALSRRARRRKQRQMREQMEDEQEEPENVIEVRGWKVYLVESVRRPLTLM
jgi:hypothetical protein